MAMTGMLDLADILEMILNQFNDSSKRGYKV